MLPVSRGSSELDVRSLWLRNQLTAGIEFKQGIGIGLAEEGILRRTDAQPAEQYKLQQVQLPPSPGQTPNSCECPDIQPVAHQGLIAPREGMQAGYARTQEHCQLSLLGVGSQVGAVDVGAVLANHGDAVTQPAHRGRASAAARFTSSGETGLGFVRGQIRLPPSQWAVPGAPCTN